MPRNKAEIGELYDSLDEALSEVESDEYGGEFIEQWEEYKDEWWEDEDDGDDEDFEPGLFATIAEGIRESVIEWWNRDDEEE